MPTMGFKWVGPVGGDRARKAAVPSPVKSLDPLSDEPLSSLMERSNGRDAPDDAGTNLGNEGESSGAPISANRVDAPANIQKESKARKGKKTFNAMNVKAEECYDASTDEEGGEPIGRSMLKAVAVKKEEDVDTDDELPGADDSGANAAEEGPPRGDPHLVAGAGKATKTFDKRVEELRAYREEHGHVNVKKSEDKSLYQFCADMRYAHRNPEKPGLMKLTAERIASLEALGLVWEPKKRQHAFERRLEELKAYKAEHGHLNVKMGEYKSLYKFCVGIRSARKNPESRKGRTLTADRIDSLDELGFDWKMQQSKREKVEAE